MIGTLKFFNLTGRYGFLRPQDGSPDIFLHQREVERAGINPASLKKGDVMRFTVGPSHGRVMATQLELLERAKLGCR